MVFGVFLLAGIEKRVRKMMPESMDTVLTPVLTLIFCLIPYIFLVMPAFGYISTGIAWAVGKVCMSESVIVRAAAGFISTAIFLPLVAMGMHHGLIALYTVQLQTLGFVTLYPALAMAGAGQVGAAIAILQKAKETGNSGMIRIIRGALPAGFLGVGEPLIYGVTLPMGKPFLTAGLGAGFGGAFVMIMQVASTTWGPSGLLGIFVMTAGPNGAVRSILYYLIGLGISYVMGYLITKAAVPAEETKPETAGHTKQAEKAEPAREAVQPENGKMEDRKPDEMRTAAAAPVSGAFVAMQDIPDPTFSEGLLGPCCGIEPDSGRICAPMDGTVTLIAETGHSFSIEGRDGLSVLVHIGIDTVKLNGEGFRVLAHLNDEVKQGEPVIEADPDFIRKNGLSAMVITAVVDNDDPDSFCFTKERMLRAGDSMILNK